MYYCDFGEGFGVGLGCGLRAWCHVLFYTLLTYLLIGTSRIKYPKPRLIANNFDIHSYRGASLSDVSQLDDAYSSTTMQTLVVVTEFNDHRNSLEDISIARRTLIEKLKDKFSPQRSIIPKIIICKDAKSSPKIQS